MNKTLLHSKKLIGKKRVSATLDADGIDDSKKNKSTLKNIDHGDTNENIIKEDSAGTAGGRTSQEFEHLVEFSHSLQAFVPVTNFVNYNINEIYDTCPQKPIHETKQTLSDIVCRIQGRSSTAASYAQTWIRRSRSGARSKDITAEIQNIKEEVHEDDTKDDEGAKLDSSKKRDKIINQFNFCERATQTSIVTKRNIETQTIPPSKGTFSTSILQWIIHDEYQKDFQEQQKNKEKKLQQTKKIEISQDFDDIDRDTKQLRNELEKWKILERMVNQNIYSDITYDFKYWEDPSDQYKTDEGTLLPLWKFTCDDTKKIAITYLTWFIQFPDLIAACYGSLNLIIPSPNGYLCLYSLKNPSYPENIIKTNASVMCVDVHVTKPHFIAIGLSTGNLMVYNMEISRTEPQYENNLMSTKHSNIIWDIKWNSDLKDGEMNFYTASADGKVNNWILMQTELIVTTITELLIDSDPVIGINETQFYRKHSITCIAFHPEETTYYLVGTEEGLIYKCNTEYCSLVFQTYQAHTMPVYRIDYNYYNYNIFISCSADWKIKIWEDNRMEPLFVFDLGTCIGDVKWAPYSSTVFAAATYYGKVYVYDININKYEPLCTQAIVSSKKSTLTKLAFNSRHPILIVGDDRAKLINSNMKTNSKLFESVPKHIQMLLL